MKIEIIASQISDNYFFLLSADDGSDGLLIDPMDANTALKRASALGVKITKVVNTHWHPDHIGGNTAVLEVTGAALYVPRDEQDHIPTQGTPLSGGDSITVGDTELRILDTPGHTKGHISLYTPGHLFCGDVVFVGGAGNCRFGGDPSILYQTFTSALDEIPDDTLLYPGHDYAVRNLEFCLHIDPDNNTLKTRLEAARKTKDDGGFVQARLGEERASSVFFRCVEPKLQGVLKDRFAAQWDKAGGASDAERAFVTVRAMRNVW